MPKDMHHVVDEVKKVDHDVSSYHYYYFLLLFLLIILLIAITFIVFYPVYYIIPF